MRGRPAPQRAGWPTSPAGVLAGGAAGGDECVCLFSCWGGDGESRKDEPCKKKTTPLSLSSSLTLSFASSYYPGRCSRSPGGCTQILGEVDGVRDAHHGRDARVQPAKAAGQRVGAVPGVGVSGPTTLHVQWRKPLARPLASLRPPSLPLFLLLKQNFPSTHSGAPIPSLAFPSPPSPPSLCH